MGYVGAFIAFLSNLPPIWNGIVGGIVVFVLTQGATSLRNWLTDRKQVIAVRKILELEIEGNLDILNKCLPSLTNMLEESRSTGRRLDPISFHIIQRQGKAFESLISAMPHALDKAEIREVFKFYQTLNEIKEYSSLISLKGEVASQELFAEQIRALDLLRISGNPLKGTPKRQRIRSIPKGMS